MEINVPKNAKMINIGPSNTPMQAVLVRMVICEGASVGLTQEKTFPLVAADVCPNCGCKVWEQSDKVTVFADSRIICPDCNVSFLSYNGQLLMEAMRKQADSSIIAPPSPLMPPRNNNPSGILNSQN